MAKVILAFCDMDGVVADTKSAISRLYGPDTVPRSASKVTQRVCDSYANGSHFFLDIEPLPNASKIVNFLVEKMGRNSVSFISAGLHLHTPGIASDKAQWLEKYFPGFPLVCVCSNEDKIAYSCPGKLLVDDSEKIRKKWIAKGGLAIDPELIKTLS